MRVLKIYNKKVTGMIELGGEGVSPGTVEQKKKDAWSMIYKLTPENAAIKVYVREGNMAE